MKEDKSKDRWDKWQIASTTVAAILLPLIGLLYTIQTHLAEDHRLEQQAKLERASKEADRAATLAGLFVSGEPKKQHIALALAQEFEREILLPHEIILVFESVATDSSTTSSEIKKETDKLVMEFADRGNTPEVREAAKKAIEKAIPSSGKPNRIYMDISDGQQPKADKIANALQSFGFTIYEIEPHTYWKAPKQTEVHYRFKGDFDNGNVQRIIDVLKNQFNLSSVVVSDENKLFVSHNAGHFEIHLAKD